MEQNNLLNILNSYNKLRIAVLSLSVVVFGLILYVLMHWQTKTLFIPNESTLITSALLSVAVILQTLKKSTLSIMIAALSLLFLLFAFSIAFFQWGKYPAGLHSSLTFFSEPIPLNSFFGFSLTALALIFLALSKRHFVLFSKILAGIVVAIGTLSLIGIVANVIPAYKWGAFSGMSLYSAIVLIITGIQIILLNIIQVDERQLFVHHYHVLLPIAIILYTTQLGVYVALLLERDAEISERLEEKTQELDARLKEFLFLAGKKIDIYSSALKDLTFDQETSQAYARTSLINPSKVFQGAILLDLDLKPIWEMWTGPPIASVTETFKDELAASKNFERHYDAENAQGGFLFFRPALNKDRGMIWVIGDFKDKNLFELSLEAFHTDYEFRVLDTNKQIIYQSDHFNEKEQGFAKRQLITKNISLNNGQWTFLLKPNSHFYSEFPSFHLPNLTFILGLLFSTITLASIFSYLKSKISEKKARSLEERLDALIISSLDAIVSVNKEGRIIGWNEGAEKIFGYKHDEAIGASFTILLPERLHQKFLEELNRFLTTGESEVVGHVFEAEGRRKTGEAFPMEGSVAHWEYHGQAFFTGILRDNTTRKSNELRLIDSKKRAEESNKLKNEFLAAISHEMRTPISAMLGYCELIQHQMPSLETVENYINIIMLNGKRLLAFAEDILEVSSFESNPIHLEIKEFSPQKVAEEVVQVMEPGAKQKSLNLILELKEPFSHLIKSDPDKIFQVLIKLVQSLIKFTKKGDIILTLSQANKEEFQFTITSTGGVLENVHLNKQIFEGTQDSNFLILNGSGLALILAKKIVEALQGSISFYTIPDYGTSFVIKINPKLKLRAKQKITERLRGKRVLLVDDNVDTLKLFAIYLKQAGVEYDTASDGQQAVDKALQALEKQQPYDLILMDLDMPILNGFDAILKLREANYLAPIAALTAFATKEEEKKCIAAGFNAIIIKPITHEKFLERVNSLVITRI